MSLNPFREALGQAGLSAFQHEKSFKPNADAALANFQSLRDELERQVRRGDLTLKVAREKATVAASQLKETLTRQAAGYSPVPRVFLDRLVEASNARKRALDHLSLEGLQRETNRLLRMTLIEQQLQTRIREFEGRTYTRAMPGGMTAPSLDSLLSFHYTASQAGDDAAVEWGRRQLEAIPFILRRSRRRIPSHSKPLSPMPLKVVTLMLASPRSCWPASRGRVHRSGGFGTYLTALEPFPKSR